MDRLFISWWWRESLVESLYLLQPKLGCSTC